MLSYLVLTVGASVLEHVVQYHTKFVQGKYSIAVFHPQQSIVLLGKTLIESKLGLNSSQFWEVLRQLPLQGTKQQYLNRRRQIIKVSFFVQCIKKQLITLQNFNIQTCFSQFLWFFSLKFWFKGQIISRIHLILPNAYKLMCFDRNINGNRDVKFLECDYLLVQRCVKLTSAINSSGSNVIFFNARIVEDMGRAPLHKQISNIPISIEVCIKTHKFVCIRQN